MTTMQNRPKQRGAVLIVALVILLILTILAVTLLQSSTIEEKLVGNYIDRNRVFQASESVLAFAESKIDGWNESPVVGEGVYALGKVTDWKNQATAYTATLTGITKDATEKLPGYAIEEYSYRCDELVVPSEDDCVIVYRVTARAKGGRNTTVELQSLYARRF